MIQLSANSKILETMQRKGDEFVIWSHVLLHHPILFLSYLTLPYLMSYLMRSCHALIYYNYLFFVLALSRTPFLFQGLCSVWCSCWCCCSIRCTYRCVCVYVCVHAFVCVCVDVFACVYIYVCVCLCLYP